MNEKKVLIPLEEYENLVKNEKALGEIQKELEKDCEERKLFVRMSLSFYEWSDFEKKYFQDPRVTLITKDDALELASKEIERLSEANKAIIDTNKSLKSAIEALENRNLFQRILNKKQVRNEE